MRVLVTGGSGFIGSHVVDRLLARGHQPRVFDLVSSARHAGEGIESIVGDILDARAVSDALEGCDAIVHLAAVADVDEVALDPLRADLVNTRGTVAMLDAARAQDVRHFVYGSTIWVYGNAPGVGVLGEDALLVAPDHLYTATKLAGEMYCRCYASMYGLAPTILRFGIPHGPGARSTTVVARFVARALAGEPLSINGDGSQARQFVYVEDLAEGIVAALDPVARGRTYNLVGEEAITVLAVAKIVSDLIGRSSIVHVPSRQSDLARVHISGRRALEDLDWRATTPFADGVARYVRSVTGTNGSPSASTAATIAGSAPTVLRHEFGAL